MRFIIFSIILIPSLLKSNEFLPRNLSLFPEFVKSLDDFVDKDAIIFKKCSSYMKRIIRSITESNLDIQTSIV